MNCADVRQELPSLIYQDVTPEQGERLQERHGPGPADHQPVHPPGGGVVKLLDLLREAHVKVYPWRP